MTNIAKINSREKKIYNLILSLLLSVAIALTSCETRDDYIFKHTSPPEIILKYEDDSTYSGKNYLNVELNMGQTIEIDMEISSKYDVVEVKYEEKYEVVQYMEDFMEDAYSIIPNENGGMFGNYNGFIINAWCEYYIKPMGYNGPYYTYTLSDEGLSIYIKDNKLIISENSKSLKDFVNRNSKINKPIAVSNYPNWDDTREHCFPLIFRNSIGNETTINLFLKINYYSAPIPEIEVKRCEDITDGYVYDITITATDPDGDDVIKYDYYFDPEIIEKTALKGYYGGYTPYGATLDLDYYGDFEIYDSYRYGYELDGFFEKNVPWDKPIGGVHNGPTTFSSIKWAFQQPGRHTIYYRCMDNTGLWSYWKEYSFNINE